MENITEKKKSKPKTVKAGEKTAEKPAAKKAAAQAAAALKPEKAAPKAPKTLPLPEEKPVAAPAEKPAPEEKPALKPIEIKPVTPKAPPKVLFAASECAPFIKTGGLADVVGSLPRELKKLGADVRVMIPEYSAIPAEYRERWTLECEFTVDMGWRKQYCGVHALEIDGVIFYFLDNKQYFGREYIYGKFTSDEAERFAFFSKAVLEAMRHLNFYPDILHAHDWQAAMTIALLRIQYSILPDYGRIRTVMTIHNLRFQGVFPWETLADLLSLPWDCFTGDKLEYFGCINFLKAGIVYADWITTVSPTYSNEIRSAYYGETLDGLLRMRESTLSGILNGIDVDTWNPATDLHIAKQYSPEDISGKSVCKEALQREFNLDGDANTPLVAMVTRMTDQKGLDLVEHVINEIVNSGVELAVLGRGDERYEGLFSWATWRYPGRVSVRFEQNEGTAHRVYAGADMFLMPSNFEPCGLSQIIAMRYGTIPIVRETGGLKDTVAPYNMFEDTGNGFTFANYNAHEMLDALYRAIGLHHYMDAWTRMMVRDMQLDFRWTRSAKEYMALYDKLRG
ncbi:MAG: glycogen synthase GlgA [Clostridia bacterium]|nr:glycogen synthase GlgA [Clostridia bacterium]